MSEGRRYAILIGSSRFENEPKLIPLKCPERDVDGMREILAAAELGAFGETFVFKDAENHVVLRRIEEVLADATRDDQVLIYYSGHGETDLPGRLYLATTNTDVKRLVSTSIPVETLRLFIENSSCRKIILILDCCYGGAVGRSFSRGSVDETLKDLARGSGVYILTASTAAQTAQEREGDDYGLLTKHIISGIKQGEADVNDDDFVSMDDLYSYVFAKVRSEGHQEPMRWALNVKGEDLIIARAGGTRRRDKQRILREKVIEVRDSLPPQVFLKALQVIQERSAPFYDLVDELYRQRLQIGEFIEEWYRVESVGRQQPPESSPLPQQLQPEKSAKIEVIERQPQPEMQSRPPTALPVPSPTPALVPVRLRKPLLIGVVVGMVVLATLGYRLWRDKSSPSGPEQQAAVGTSSPTPTQPSSRLPASVDVLSYSLEYKPGEVSKFRFHFKSRQNGFLYIVAPNAERQLITFLTARPHPETGVSDNAIKAGQDYQFFGGEQWIEMRADPAAFTLIFTTKKLAQLRFFNAAAGSQLSEYDKHALDNLRRQSRERDPELATNAAGATVRALEIPDTPLVTDIRVPWKVRGS